MLPLLVSLLPLTVTADAPSALDLSLVPLAAQDAAEAPPPAGWTGAISVGLTLTRGNSETTTIAAAAEAKHETEKDRWTTGAWYNQNEQTDQVTGVDTTTAKNYGARLQYDRFVSERLYWLANAKGEKDEAAALQFRGTAGLGLGYQFKNTETFKLNGEAGLNWVHEDLEGESPNEFLAARLAEHWDYIWTETTKLGQTGEFFPSLEDSDDWTAKVDTHADVSMTEAMFLRLQHVLDYDNTPATGAKKADNRVIVTVGWSF
jgi:putative salt-induced outer membrane protein YdiY